MARNDRIQPQNHPGRYYVDTGCIACALCPEIAPMVFREDIEEGFVFVYCQPPDEAGERLCREAMDICPVNAIGDDGDTPGP
jgi:ferredoxin